MNYTHTDTDLPIENQYPKLVRDKIPEMVKRDGKTPKTRVLSDDKEFLSYLLAKLLEESTELAQAIGADHQKEELADVYEVLEAIGSTLGITRQEVELAQSSKRQARGSFDDRILMTSNPNNR